MRLWDRGKIVEHRSVWSAFLACYDMIAVVAAYFLALWLRFDFRYSKIPAGCMDTYIKFMPVYMGFCLIIFVLFRLYRSLWEFASFSELMRVMETSVVTTVFHVVVTRVFFGKMPVSYYIMGALFQFILILAVRFSYRFVSLLGIYREKHVKPAVNAMVIGAGVAGQMIVRELQSTDKSDVKPCCIIDDDVQKWGRIIRDVPVVGGRDDILLNVEKYHIDQILFAIPSATMEERREILNICNESGCELRQLPGVYQLVNGDVTLAKLKPVAVEDLLGRSQIQVNQEEILDYVNNKVILVTGGGGSIGSELCRQIAGHSPRKLIIFDIYENNAYDIEQELRQRYPNLDLTVLIGSVRDSARVNNIFQKYQPDIVYHAAAHKHVPLMEGSPCESVKNNVVGTYKTAYAALMNHCQRFVLISTDKAVNPTNIMGASKRLCEMIIQSMDRVSRLGREDMLPLINGHSRTDESDSYVDMKLHDGEGQARMEAIPEHAGRRTEFVAVRFGNVLGSNGSVIPLFRKQIEKGGPVTVTHPDIIRYFMTIPEAVSLVLQAGAYARGGEIFVLDMGEPVKIDSLARNLIKLSGYEPDVDIHVTYTGLRPGEKLYEEKLLDEEGTKRTPNHLIHIGVPIEMNDAEFFRDLERLAIASYANDEDIKQLVAGLVTTYHV